jgi:hypothetical protein
MTKFAESFDKSETLELFKRLSKKHKVYTITTIPEKANESQLFNTGIAVQILKYRFLQKGNSLLK